ncbi:leucine-rich repeat-containing 24 [Brachionus plicatilis]|uniref:Leucine-rich repeat-containing 24 n=1 Tax=Brachionus plicatilis TaxID=10195 RepID=A0A3M7P8H7_BRAPC|nr:leucine-rich repeat-containing 24 [Brachionus plicatilis]
MNQPFLAILLLLSAKGMKFEYSTCPNFHSIWKFNCSFKEVKWSNLVKLDENVRGSRYLDLSNNLFSTETQGNVIKNFSFNLFKQLSNTLNLSSNQFTKIESHAFYYIATITDDIYKIKFNDSDLKILDLEELDLSNNSFEIIPWNSVKNLPKLVTLRLSKNPIRRVDQADMTNSMLSHFENFSNLYLNNCQIEYVNPVTFDLVKNLKILDLSGNRIKYIDNFSKTTLTSLYLFGNPLECNCRLLWFKNFLLNRNFKSADYKNSRHTCLGNTKTIKKDFIVESKILYFNASTLLVTNKSLAQSGSLVDVSTETIYIVEIKDNNFYCDFKIKNEIENLGISSGRLRKIRLNCIVENYPEPQIRWINGEKDIVRDLSSSKIFQTDSNTTKGDLTYKVMSWLTVSLEHPFSYDIKCSVFYKSSPKLDEQPRPLHSRKEVQFTIINQNKDENFPNRTFSSLNFTELTYLPSVQKNMFKDQPVIYYIIFGVLFLFCFFVIILASVCLIRQKRSVKKEQQDYGYSGSDYSSINKRSTIYTGSNSLRADSATIVPLKPDVIREHHDFGSVCGNFYRTPSRPSNYLNTLMISPESINQNYDDNDSVYTNNHSIPIYNGSRQMHQSFDNNPVENSFFDDTTSSSRFSSKTFEENTDEYREPKFDDLRKPNKNIKQSMI